MNINLFSIRGIEVIGSFTACLTLTFPSPVYSQESISRALAEAANAIEQARKAGAERNAQDDLATANSWFAQADKANAAATSLLGRVATAGQRKTREDEILYLSGMARIKALTAEARAKNASTLAEAVNAQKTVAEYQGIIRLANERSEEADRARGDSDKARETQARADAERRQLAEAQSRADAERQKLADAQRQIAQSEAQRATELAAAQEAQTRQAQARQKEADEAKTSRDQLAQLEAKLLALQQERAIHSAAAKVSMATVRSIEGDIVFTLLVPSIFSPANELIAAGRQSLDQLGLFLNAYPNNKVVIRSYTDDRGTPTVNKGLSERRAQKVRDYLNSKGIPAARLLAEGFGASDPVAPNATDTGRALNRRVEVRVTSAK